MNHLQTLITLAQWLAGEFENRSQALEQPAWFVHLHLWHRPLPQRIQGKLALFAEQANVLYLEQTYRQRVILLQETEQSHLQVQYLELKQPERLRGAGANPSRLNQLSLTDLEWLPGCTLAVTQQTETFMAQPEPGAKCCFPYEGKTRQVILGFVASAVRFLSYDRGVDPDTGQALWGALMGPYEFNKCQDFSAELPP
jgi:hypothetical protein